VSDDRDNWGDAFSHDWGATPESRARDACAARVYQAIDRDDADELRRVAAAYPDWRGGDVFHDAVRRGSIECVRFLLGLGNLAGEPDECGGTPLAYAAEVGLDLVKLLIEAGADANTLAEDFVEVDEDCRFRTPLFWAALAGRQEVVEYLAPLTDPDLRRRIPELLR
jgi:ankyrin repeat protein